MDDFAARINQTLLSAIFTNTSRGSWGAKCITILNDSQFLDASLVDRNGKAIYNLTEQTWGMDVQTCYQQCNSTAIPFDFNFQDFSASMTNYFLPWLALTAQLPFETGDPWTNAMSFCLAVGSPALLTYSLTITILNRLLVRNKFERLRTKVKRSQVEGVKEYDSRIRAAQFLLQEAQQVPLRASQERGWLSSLIVSPVNEKWWLKLEGRLKSTRRGVTASLVAQMSLAAIAYLFTIIASYLADLGDPDTALQIASGSIWIWLIPLILGFVTVGTQSSSHFIEDALQAEPAARAMHPPIQDPDHPYDLLDQQHGLVVRGGLSPQPERLGTHTVVGGFAVPHSNDLRIPTWLGANVGGDEELRGPIHNYARAFTWWQLAANIERAMVKTLDNMYKREPCVSSHGETPAWNAQIPSLNLVADANGTARYCGLEQRPRDQTHPIKAYSQWTDMEGAVYRHIFTASVAAIFVQWGTTGSSVLIAYLTPTVGLGCRSGGYLFYGGLATLAWLSLIIAQFLSHEVMLRYQTVHLSEPNVVFRRDPSVNTKASHPPTLYERTWAHSLLCGLAVSFRYLGKCLCIANTLWLIMSSLFEFTGAYANCWCEGNAFGMGDHGWVVLFKDSADLAAAARLPWGGGLIMTVVVCFASYIFFALGSSKSEED